MNRVKDKIEEISEYLEELGNILPESYEKYTENLEKKAACERYFEKIVETIVSLAYLVIKEKNFEQPTEDIQVFDILMSNGIISDNLRINLKNAKGMRNILAHEYGKIDDELVFESLIEEIIKDAEEFIKQIEDSI